MSKESEEPTLSPVATTTGAGALPPPQESKANITISGLIQLYSWTTKHPQYGHEIVGVVMKWSPKDEKQARKLREWKPERNKTNERKLSSPKKRLKGVPGTKSGEAYMDLDDF